MGAKNSVTKHHLGSSSTGASGRGHQNEEIHDVSLVTHQKMNRQITTSSSPHLPTGDVTLDNLLSELKSRSKGLSDGIDAAAAEAVTPTTCSPTGIKRYHPYDEVNEEQLSCSQKCENKIKQKDGMKDKTGKKTSERKGSDSTHPEISNLALKSDALPCSSEHVDRFHPYDEITEDMLGSDRTKWVNKEDISKFQHSREKADKKNQKGLPSVPESRSLETTSKLNITTDNIKPAARGHTYEEISNEHLTSNRENKKVAKQEKPKKKGFKDKAGKKPDKTVPENSSIDNHSISTTRLLLNPGSENPQTRYHPYDEITQNDLDSHTKVMTDKSGQLHKQKSEENENKNQTASNSSETEYLNMGEVQAALVEPCVDRCTGKQNQENQECLENVYAVPQKKKLKDQQNKQLNYIEVEFTPTAGKAEVKSQFSPTAYSNVVCKDGKILLSES